MGAIVAAVVVVFVIVVMIASGGEHGPMRHIPSAAGTIEFDSLVLRL